MNLKPYGGPAANLNKVTGVMWEKRCTSSEAVFGYYFGYYV